MRPILDTLADALSFFARSLGEVHCRSVDLGPRLAQESLCVVKERSRLAMESMSLLASGFFASMANLLLQPRPRSVEPT
jgi:hypothetical protein